MKIDLSVFMNKSIFESIDGVYKNSSDLSKLKDSVQNSNVSNIKTNESGVKNTYFVANINGSESVVGVNLSKNTIEKLKDFFSNDINIDTDGTVFLSGKANKYISGWFNDIAFRRGFIAADSENKGYVDEKGLKDLFIDSRSKVASSDNGMSYVLDFENYLKVDSRLIAAGAYNNFRQSIDDVLEDTIKMDTDFDGKISVKENEIFLNKDNIETITDDSLIIKAEMLDLSTNSFNFTFSNKNKSYVADDRQKREFEILEAIAALTRIAYKINNDGVESLTNDDKDKLSLLNITPESLKSPQKLLKASDVSLDFIANSIGLDSEFIEKSKQTSGYLSSVLQKHKELSLSIIKDFKKHHLLDIKA